MLRCIRHDDLRPWSLGQEQAQKESRQKGSHRGELRDGPEHANDADDADAVDATAADGR